MFPKFKLIGTSAVKTAFTLTAIEISALMNFLRCAVVMLCCLAVSPLRAQTIDDYMVPKGVLILQSTRSYSAALKTAREAARALGYELQLRGLKPNRQEGLTYSPAECDSNGWEWPCYVARGRYDDGSFVSIERSDAYEGFSKGYYIVVAATGEPGSPEMKAALDKAKQRYKTAYVKTTKVYMGCMH